MTATNLGLRGDANNVKDVYKWSAAGIPQSWQPGTLKTWLEQGKWTNVQYVIAPQTARGRWTFAAKPPNGHISTSLRICALDDTTVTIARWARGRPQYTEQKMKGFNRWLHAPSSRFLPLFLTRLHRPMRLVNCPMTLQMDNSLWKEASRLPQPKLTLRTHLPSQFPRNKNLELWRKDLCQGELFLVSERKDKALQAWRERMRNNQSAQFKRVAKTSSPMTMNLFHSDQPDSVTTNVTQAFQMLKSFWVDVWKGHDLDEQATNAAWGRGYILTALFSEDMASAWNSWFR